MATQQTKQPTGSRYSDQGEDKPSLTSPLMSSQSPSNSINCSEYSYDYDSNRSYCSNSLSESEGTGPSDTSFTSCSYIDNTLLRYTAVTLPCGVIIKMGCGVSPYFLHTLQVDLESCLRVLPTSVHAIIRHHLRIWVNDIYRYGPVANPITLRHSTTHHCTKWLTHCANDIPEKAKSIEIYSASQFQLMRLHWNGCGLLLHEICHILHQHVFGLHYEPIKRVYQHYSTNVKFHSVLRRDWAGRVKALKTTPPCIDTFDNKNEYNNTKFTNCFISDDRDMAYAMVNFKEFFAEVSVSFLSRGYPSIPENSNNIFISSPPLIQPVVVEAVLQAKRKQNQPQCNCIDPSFQEIAIQTNCRATPHCNKFYPFTSQQLKKFDPELYHICKSWWYEIACYQSNSKNDDDDNYESDCCCFWWSWLHRLPWRFR